VPSGSESISGDGWIRFQPIERKVKYSTLLNSEQAMGNRRTIVETKYTLNEWRMALDIAEINDFNGVTSGREGGPLAAFLCEMFTRGPVGGDSDLLEAVINVIEEDGGTVRFSQKRFRTVLKSSRGDTVADFEALTAKYLQKNHGISLEYLPGNPDADDFKTWYLRNAVSETKTYTEVTSGGSFYWFDRTKW
jgi:hypothetical protein